MATTFSGFRPAPKETSRQLQANVNHILGWGKTDQFPARMGCRLYRAHLHTLVEQQYFTCSVPDGIRYLLLILRDSNYLINEQYNFFQVSLPFPLRRDRVVPGSDCFVHNWTLLDVHVTLPIGGIGNPNLRVNDILMLNGRSLLECPLLERMKRVQNDVVAPHKRMIVKMRQFIASSGSSGAAASASTTAIDDAKARLAKIQCEVSMREMHPAKKVEQVLTKAGIPSTAAPPDVTAEDSELKAMPLGTIQFVPMGPYSLGAGGATAAVANATTLLVWRMAEANTMCFKLAMEWRGRPPRAGFKLMLSKCHLPVFYDWISLSPVVYDKLHRNAKAASMVAECQYSATWPTLVPNTQDRQSWEPPANSPHQHPVKGSGWRAGGWRYVRSRSDVGEADDVTVLEQVQQALHENIAANELVLLLAYASGSDTPSAAAASNGLNEQDQVRRARILAHAKSEASAAKVRASGKSRGGAAGGGNNFSGNGNTGNSRGNARKARGDVGADGELGVCYDWQNKGFCRRGDGCPFAHCACNTICVCMPLKNTWGQRPQHKEEREKEERENEEREKAMAEGVEGSIPAIPAADALPMLGAAGASAGVGAGIGIDAGTSGGVKDDYDAPPLPGRVGASSAMSLPEAAAPAVGAGPGVSPFAVSPFAPPDAVLPSTLPVAVSSFGQPDGASPFAPPPTDGVGVSPFAALVEATPTPTAAAAAAAAAGGGGGGGGAPGAAAVAIPTTFAVASAAAPACGTPTTGESLSRQSLNKPKPSYYQIDPELASAAQQKLLEQQQKKAEQKAKQEAKAASAKSLQMPGANGSASKKKKRSRKKADPPSMPLPPGHAVSAARAPQPPPPPVPAQAPAQAPAPASIPKPTPKPLAGPIGGDLIPGLHFVQQDLQLQSNPLLQQQQQQPQQQQQQQPQKKKQKNDPADDAGGNGCIKG
jgi:hypothetical protein